MNFYPRSPCGERLLGAKRRPCMGRISIHALLAESDTFCARGAGSERGISIHALLAESDTKAEYFDTAMANFYPRSPCGERLSRAKRHAMHIVFLSTLSLRRATKNPPGRHKDIRDFYPRSPCGERRQVCYKMLMQSDFYPRSPCGERQITRRGFACPI